MTCKVWLFGKGYHQSFGVHIPKYDVAETNVGKVNVKLERIDLGKITLWGIDVKGIDKDSWEYDLCPDYQSAEQRFNEIVEHHKVVED